MQGPVALAYGEVGIVGVVETRVWTSRDGREWTPVGAVPDTQDATMADVSAGSAGFVVVGSRAPCRTASGAVVLAAACVKVPPGQAAVWVSTDGTVWDSVADGDLDPPTDRSFLTMQAVTAGLAGFVAVGNESMDEGTVTKAAAWVSPDGRVWTRASDSAAFANAGMSDVVETDGGFFAVGFQDLAARVWRSADGLGWTVVDPRIGPFNLMSVAASSRGFVVAGLGGTTRRLWTVWASPDGAAWTQASLPVELEDEHIGLRSLVAVDNGFLGASERGIWASPDGLDWVKVAGEMDAFYAVAVRSGRAVATGNDPEMVPVAWTGPAGVP